MVIEAVDLKNVYHEFVGALINPHSFHALVQIFMAFTKWAAIDISYVCGTALVTVTLLLHNTYTAASLYQNAI